MTRMVRAGRRPLWGMALAAATVMAPPAPSSMAPVPRSQLSMCEPRTMISSGRLAPGRSPITFWLWVS